MRLKFSSSMFSRCVYVANLCDRTNSLLSCIRPDLVPVQGKKGILFAVPGAFTPGKPPIIDIRCVHDFFDALDL